MSALLVKHFFRDVCKFQSVVNFDCDFTLLPGASDVHYNFQAKKEIVSCQFYVIFVGETFFFRDMRKLQSVGQFQL